ncbi:hypothetical protein GF325_15500 [Candidatus Bathyarchaeota archaeon]|nr:hypothetical protein [Candidatus Bathyarchaeota archaeon]
MDLKTTFTNILKSSMYKIAGINQMVLIEKTSGNVISSFSKFSRADNLAQVAEFSLTLDKLSQLNKRNLEVNTIEFDTGEKLFTINGGKNLILSAVSDKNTQIGISRMYLKKLAKNLDGKYPLVKSKLERFSRNRDLANIFGELIQKDS